MEVMISLVSNLCGRTPKADSLGIQTSMIASEMINLT